MFYLDFTSPEGKTCRIDIEKYQIIYECPVCGDRSIYIFDSSVEGCCFSCAERREQETRIEARIEYFKRIADKLSRADLSKAKGSDRAYWKIEARDRGVSLKYLPLYLDLKISSLERKHAELLEKNRRLEKG